MKKRNEQLRLRSAVAPWMSDQNLYCQSEVKKGHKHQKRLDDN